jgi:hypothetical protein
LLWCCSTMRSKGKSRSLPVKRERHVRTCTHASGSTSSRPGTDGFCVKPLFLAGSIGSEPAICVWLSGFRGRGANQSSLVLGIVGLFSPALARTEGQHRPGLCPATEPSSSGPCFLPKTCPPGARPLTTSQLLATVFTPKHTYVIVVFATVVAVLVGGANMATEHKRPCRADPESWMTGCAQFCTARLI